MELTFTLTRIHEAATRCWKAFSNHKVIAFHGGMGSGKTTFIHALCDQKKVAGVVSSPTYSIINEYEFPGGKIIHMDLYRLKDLEEALQAGVEDYLYSGHTCFVEWPEIATPVLPAGAIHVYLAVVDDVTRNIRIAINDYI